MKALRLAMLLAVAAVPAGVHAQQANQPEQKKVVPPIPRQQEKIFPVGTSWVAVSLGGRSFGGGERPSFSLDNQFRGRGFGGCNNYSATVYPLRQQTLAVGPIAVTKRKCAGGANAMEQSFLIALRSAQKWDIVGSTLIMYTGRGELRFSRSL